MSLPVSPERWSQVDQLIRQGYTTERIAKELRMSPKVIRRRRHPAMPFKDSLRAYIRCEECGARVILPCVKCAILKNGGRAA
jgi:hypothetical protein